MPTLLFVPFEEKDQAKALGARWDPNNKTWYIPDHLDPSLFQKWLTPEGITEPTIISDEFYLLDSTVNGHLKVHHYGHLKVHHFKSGF